MPLLFQLQITSTTVFWLLCCVLLGVAYAFIMYRQLNLSRLLNRGLFLLRTLAIAAIAFLLFAPMVKFSGKAIERPLIIIVQDNSASIALSKPASFDTRTYTQRLKELERTLGVDYEVKTLTFGVAVKPGLNTDFNESLTDINAVFKYINDKYSNRNIGAVVLSSDGIYNYGGNPEYQAQNLKSPIYTVALGDTVPKRDLLISNINYNNIVYLDNDFEVEVDVEAFQSKGVPGRLTVSDEGGTVFTKSFLIGSNEFRLTIPVPLSAKKKGIKRFTANLSPLKGELSERNNTHTFFIDVIDGKNKILILANSPHPDISALKQSIDLNKNYQVKSVLASEYKMSDISDAGLLILHQLPSKSSDLQKILQQASGKPLWFILGAQTDIAEFSAAQNVLNISAAGNTEEVVAKVSGTFHDFTLSGNTVSSIQNFGPLIAPFGSYSIKTQASVLLNQQIGKIATDRPLLQFYKDTDRKIAVLSGEGLWRWRLENFREAGNHQAVDELITKTIQFMVSKDDKRRFRVYTAKNTFDENEHILLNAELYNENYELINTPDVSIALKHHNKKIYPFLFSRTGNGYILDAGVLPAGEYTYEANTQLGKVRHVAKGRFVIVQQQAEYRQTTANHQLLHNLSQLNNAELIYPSELSSLAEKIKKNELVKTISYESRKYEELVNVKTIFFIILALLSLEWFLRKRNGEV